MNLTINHWTRLDRRMATRDGVPLLSPGRDMTPEDVYRELQLAYPKFFKMDVLCKWAWTGAECLLNENGAFLYEGIDKNKVALVLATAQGCLETDKKYRQSMESIPSPALFVYTLSNIMLGEICIRHGFKGEQACLVHEGFDSAELYFYVHDLMSSRGMEACLCGWVDAVNYQHDVSMFWVGKGGSGLTFSPAVLQQLYDSQQ